MRDAGKSGIARCRILARTCVVHTDRRLAAQIHISAGLISYEDGEMLKNVLKNVRMLKKRRGA
eukprot:6967-Chlamydomonas_euryale.AAC.1